MVTTSADSCGFRLVKKGGAWILARAFAGSNPASPASISFVPRTSNVDGRATKRASIHQKSWIRRAPADRQCCFTHPWRSSRSMIEPSHSARRAAIGKRHKGLPPLHGTNGAPRE